LAHEPDDVVFSDAVLGPDADDGAALAAGLDGGGRILALDAKAVVEGLVLKRNAVF
jgi:hypothetical protein